MSDFNFPIVLDSTGLQPQSPSSIQAQLLAEVSAQSPGYTANLPGILIEDILDTDVAAVQLIDQAKVDTVNSLTPFGANEFTLAQLGQIYIGQARPGLPTNTSVGIVGTGTVGYVMPRGMLVSDGTNSFQLQDSGVIKGSGSSDPITAIATQSGSFAVGINTVTQIKTSVPASVVLSITNPAAGTPGGIAETWFSFRQRVLQAGLAACIGSPRLIKTLLARVPGVLPNLISVTAVSGALRIVVGGGDNYNVAAAIFAAVANPADLTGHAVGGTNVTVSLIDPPNTYNILFVRPGVQTVTVGIVWNTTVGSFTGGGAFASLVQPPLVAYINSLAVGAPINVLQMNQIFEEAVAGLLDPQLLTRLVFSVSINGTPTPVTTGTYIVVGDAESSFFTAADGSGITVSQA